MHRQSRAFLLQALTAVLPLSAALVVQGVLFGAQHQQIGLLLPLTVTGYFWGVMYVHSRNLLVPIFIHACAATATLPCCRRHCGRRRYRDRHRPRLSPRSPPPRGCDHEAARRASLSCSHPVCFSTPSPSHAGRGGRLWNARIFLGSYLGL